MLQIPTIQAIQNAHKLIKPFIHQTPIMASELLNKRVGCNLFFKCENFQKVGAFKFRGATHAVLRLSDTEKKQGVATHSSGNHAAALAKAATMNGIIAHIVMPNNAPKVKIEAVQSYGGNITFCEPTLKARESTLLQILATTNATMVHPYDNYNVICGQGTACLELSQQIAEPDIVMAPIGGGGLMSGTSISAKSLWKNTKIFGAEPEMADDAYQSFQAKKLILAKNTNTVADGLRTSLSPLTFEIISSHLNELLTCKEESIVKAMELIYKYMKIVIEPSSAVPLAVILDHPEKFAGKNVAIILSGGNVDLKKLPF
jgi:threonine dehydratase